MYVGISFILSSTFLMYKIFDNIETKVLTMKLILYLTLYAYNSKEIKLDVSWK